MLKTNPTKSNETKVTQFDDLPNDTVTYLTKTYLSSSEAYFFAQSSKRYRALWLIEYKDKAQQLKELFQAIIDDHQDTVKKILDKDPWLLLEIPEKNQTLKSEFTHQIVDLAGFTGLQVALLRDQLEMTKLILPYFNQIRDGSQEALKQWEACDVIKEAKKERIKAYGSKMKILIEDIAGKTKNKFDEIDFRTGLLPKDKAIRLDSYVDIEALLLSAYKAYHDYFYTFKDGDQRSEFCIKVIGFLQSLVSPETAKVFCESLYYVVGKRRNPGDVAKSLKLVNEPNFSFYRSSGDSSVGLGFDFLIGGGGARWGWMRDECVGKLCQSKAGEFCELKGQLKAGCLPTLEAEPVTSYFCLIQ